MTRSYEYAHTVGFEETNFVGNVYYANHLRWQGRCREMFLRDKSPGVLAELQNGLAFITTRCSCEYFAELEPFDEIVIRMTLLEHVQNRVTMGFDYIRLRDGGEELVARGEQQIASMRRSATGLTPEAVPTELRDALRQYAQ
ncbi:MAG: acyl-CoA thioesterase [Planctomycetota bacterium]